MELTISRIQPPLPTSTVIALLLPIFNTAVRVTQLMSLPCSKSFGTSCPIQRVSVIVIASQLQTHSSILDFTLLGLGPWKPPFSFVSWLPVVLGQLGVLEGDGTTGGGTGSCSFLFCFLWVFHQLVAPVSGVSALLHPGSGSSFLQQQLNPFCNFFHTQEPISLCFLRDTNPAAISPSQWCGLQPHGIHPLLSF